MMRPTATPEIHDKPERPGFSTWNCAQPMFPILLSVPHAGREYPPAIFDNLRVEPAHLVRLEDRYADRLAQPAIRAGFPVIVAERARAWIDLNRDEGDLDPEMVHGWTAPRGQLGSLKMRGGLGLIPRRLASLGEIWRNPISKSEVDARISGYHRPYHQRIEDVLATMRRRFGKAILLDLHSMPTLPPAINPQPQIVVGDRFGQCAAPIYAEMLLGRLRDLGFPVALNNPYPGDYVLRRHGQPHKDIHAIQLEIDRQLYIDTRLNEPTGHMATMAGIIAELLLLLTEQIAGPALPIAAE